MNSNENHWPRCWDNLITPKQYSGMSGQCDKCAQAITVPAVAIEERSPVVSRVRRSLIFHIVLLVVAGVVGFGGFVPSQVEAAGSVEVTDESLRSLVWEVPRKVTWNDGKVKWDGQSTAWLLQGTERDTPFLVWVSSAHGLREALPSKMKWPNSVRKVEAFLKHSSGISIQILEKNVHYLDERDIAIIVVPRANLESGISAPSPFEFAYEHLSDDYLILLTDLKGRSVFNLGFSGTKPSKIEYHYVTPRTMSGVVKNFAYFGRGSFQKNKNYRVQSQKTSLSQLGDFFLVKTDYAAKVGMSGGPLLLEGSNLIIGMFIITGRGASTGPAGQGPQGSTRGLSWFVSIVDILEFANRLGLTENGAQVNRLREIMLRQATSK